MSWTTNDIGECNNTNCRATIYWNPLIRHNVTNRQRPLNKPYYPDQQQQPDLHLCMKNKRPGRYINKYNKVEWALINPPIRDINYSHDLYVFLTKGYPQ